MRVVSSVSMPSSMENGGVTDVVEHVDLAGQHLDLAGGHVRVHGVGAAVAHRAGDLQGILAAQMLGLVEILLGHAIGVDDHLGVAGAIAQVAEDRARRDRGCATPNRISVTSRPTSDLRSSPHVASCMQNSLM